MDAERRFPVIEVFGPTIQGEGPEVGTQCLFVRFGGCDYRCTWCDSSHAVLPELVRENAVRWTAQEIVEEVMRLDHAPLVVLSGGNPLLHDLRDVVALLHLEGYRVSVETQGTQWKPWINMVDQVVVSPKPPSSAMGDGEQVTELLLQFVARTTVPTAIKVPCLDERDVRWASDLPGLFPGVPFFLSVVTLMGGLYGTDKAIDTTDDLLARYRDVIAWARQEPTLCDARILPQVHALTWGHERGH